LKGNTKNENKLIVRDLVIRWRIHEVSFYLGHGMFNLILFLNEENKELKNTSRLRLILIFYQKLHD